MNEDFKKFFRDPEISALAREACFRWNVGEPAALNPGADLTLEQTVIYMAYAHVLGEMYQYISPSIFKNEMRRILKEVKDAKHER